MRIIQPIKEVNIILDESGHAKDFEREKLIHEYEYDMAINFIDEMIPVELSKKANKYLHNTITIFGTRGSGKTSFLLSLKKAYSKHKKLKVLRIIDPTLIEEKGHVFLNVIAAIREEVFEAFDEMNSDDSVRELKRKWRDSMMRLAAGLPSIDGMGNHNQDSWQDPEYVLDKGLVSVGSALNLSEYFDGFLKISLEILKKTSFLLIFDDIDIDATKGWAVLETIRKYFTTSRLVTVLSGDLKLYSMVVRQKKWSNFGAEILRYEGEYLQKLPYFNSMVTELESQYLQKIMQPRYRIHLLSLQEKKQINRLPKIYVKQKELSEKPGTEIQELYGMILARFGIHNISQSEVFKTFILTQPFRTQIQFASTMGAYLSYPNTGENSEKITDVFLADLLDQEIDVNLINSTTKFLNSVTLRLLLKRSQLKDLYQLQPSTTDNSLNACLLSLNLLLSKSFFESNFYLSFDYLIKIGYIRNLTNILTEVEAEPNQPSIIDLCEKTGVFNDGVLRDTIGKINAYLMGAMQSRNARNNTAASYINLLGLNGPAKRLTEDRLDFIFPNDGSVRSILGYIPSYSASYSFKNQSSVGYSIYLVIGSIGELVRIFESHTHELEGITITERVKSALRELSQHRQYPVPDFKSGEIIGNLSDKREAVEEIGDYLNQSGDDKESLVLDDLFVSNIISWLEATPKRAVTPHVLGKISTRFYSALQNMFDRRPLGLPLGDFFHFQIVALMNAILIEDVRENMLDSSQLNLNNTSFSERLLIDNLQNTLDKTANKLDNAKLDYSRWMLSCPLLVAYIAIQKDNVLNKLLERYIGDYNIAQLYDTYDLCKSLNMVTIEANGSKNQKVSFERSLFNRSLAKEGNEQQLINTVMRKHGNTLPLSQINDIGVMAERNRTLKRILPNLFPNNDQYSSQARKLRVRLKKLGLIE